MKAFTKSNLFLYISLALYLSFVSCSKDSNSVKPPSGSDTLIGSNLGVFVPKADLPVDNLGAVGRSFAVSFSIGGFGYIGTGIDSSSRGIELQDFWKYDAASNNWAEVSSIPVARQKAVAFVINGKGYVGTGIQIRPDLKTLSDFWQYDAITNKWQQVKSMPDNAARYAASAFSIGDTGYVLCGENFQSALKDMYKYDAVNDIWTEDGFSGNKRFGATAFVYNQEGYILGGCGDSLLTDFYKYNPLSTPSWVKLRDITDKPDSSFDDNYKDIVRLYAVSLVVSDTAYIIGGMGYPESNNILSVWGYDFKKDRWQRHPSIPSPGFSGGVSFMSQNNSFVATGNYVDPSGVTSYSAKNFEFEPNISIK